MKVTLKHNDCMNVLPTMPDNSVDFTLTDIPYNEVNRGDNGLRKLDKEHADILTFDLHKFLEEILRVTKNNICVFCGREQFSEIYKFFSSVRGGGYSQTDSLGKIQPLSDERRIRLFKRRGIRGMVQKERLKSLQCAV